MVDLNDYRELLSEKIQDELIELDDLLENDPDETDQIEEIINNIREKGFIVETGLQVITEINHVDGNNSFLTDKLKEAFKEINDEELIELWNEYCRESKSEDEIYHNDDNVLEDLFSEIGECVRAIFYGDYNYSHKYMQFNGYANLESFDYILERIDQDELADSLIDNEEFDLISD